MKCSCDNLIEFFNTQKFENIINEAFIVDEIRFTGLDGLIEVLSILREQLIFNFLIQNFCKPKKTEEFNFYHLFEDKNYSYKEMLDNLKYVQVYLIPLLDALKLGLIVSFKIGGVILSGTFSIFKHWIIYLI